MGEIWQMMCVAAALGWPCGVVAALPQLEFREWNTASGYRHEGDLAEYRWSDRSLLLSQPGEAGMRALAAQDLDLESKVRLLLSEPFQESYLAHREELEALPVYQARLRQLRQLGIIFCGVYTSGFVAVSWFLAGTILGSSSMGRWFLVFLLSLLLTAGAVWFVWWGLGHSGEAKIRELLGVAAASLAVLQVFAVWAVYRSGFFRSFWWCLCNAMAAILLPLTLAATGLAAQVYGHYEVLNLGAVDQYLTEVWLVPMGLI